MLTGGVIGIEDEVQVRPTPHGGDRDEDLIINRDMESPGGRLCPESLPRTHLVMSPDTAWALPAFADPSRCLVLQPLLESMDSHLASSFESQSLNSEF